MDGNNNVPAGSDFAKKFQVCNFDKPRKTCWKRNHLVLTLQVFIKLHLNNFFI